MQDRVLGVLGVLGVQHKALGLLCPSSLEPEGAVSCCPLSVEPAPLHPHSTLSPQAWPMMASAVANRGQGLLPHHILLAWVTPRVRRVVGVHHKVVGVGRRVLGVLCPPGPDHSPGWILTPCPSRPHVGKRLTVANRIAIARP